MADLIAIAYEDETTAHEAAEEVHRLADDLAIQPDAVAVVVRDGESQYEVTTHHHPVAAGATWGMFWGLLFGVLFFIPVCGVAVGSGLGAILAKVTETGIDREFAARVRDMVKPGTSCLFLLVEKVTPDKAIEGLRQYGGAALSSSLSSDAQAELQEALHGVPAVA
jgi:uncharacterized membrane protein